jgi:hypothetical protein
MAEGSHIVSVAGLERSETTAIYLRAGDSIRGDARLTDLLQAVSDSLEHGQLCVIEVRSLLLRSTRLMGTQELRSWTLTPVGLIPATAAELARAHGITAFMASVDDDGTPVQYMNAWDDDLFAGDGLSQ